MIEIRTLKAKQGDCIWVRCIFDKIVNIIIDAGPITFKNGFINLMDTIKCLGERVDLLVFTHVDDDHIKGCIKYLKSDEDKIINKVWINGNGCSVYLDNQEHSVKNVSSLIKLLSDNNIPIEAPILEKKESFFGQVKIKVIGPTVQDMVRVAKRIETHYCKEHSGRLYLGNISDAEDKYKPDTSETNNASIIMVIEYDNKKLLFTGDSSAENIITAVNKYYQNTWFDIFKLPHHGSQHNISRELIKRIKANKYIISTNKTVEKVVLLRMVEENETTELLCNYNWWNLGYFTDDDLTRYINTGIIVLTDIGEEKVII